MAIKAQEAVHEMYSEMDREKYCIELLSSRPPHGKYPFTTHPYVMDYAWELLYSGFMSMEPKERIKYWCSILSKNDIPCKERYHELVYYRKLSDALEIIDTDEFVGMEDGDGTGLLIIQNFYEELSGIGEKKVFDMIDKGNYPPHIEDLIYSFLEP